MTALYVHIPYCRSKCRYCDFASVQVDGSVPAYLDALSMEATESSRIRQPIETVYVGGGTPTVLPRREIARLFELLGKHFDISSDAEITVEANPCSLGPETAKTLAGCGVNRVSLGAQSFVDTELGFLGRLHVAADILRCVSLLRDTGIENICIDLIFAIPGQTHESWRHSLSKAIELKPRHVSAYCLTFEPSTPLWQSLQNGSVEKRSDDEELELYEIARDTLIQNGYEHYEVSNFALPGKRSRHNMVYWSNEEYLGLGAGAVSYIDGVRVANMRGPAEYIRAMKANGRAACEIEEIPVRMQAIETMIQQLRMKDGIDCSAFKERFAIHPRELFDGAFDELVELGLLEHTPDTIRSTIKGWHLANEVALRILP